jgi:pimeloyl-ACP methyl ester carboxylesterase
MIRRLVGMAVLLAGGVCAQSPSIVGTWLGTVEAGPQKLRLGFHISENGKGELTSTLDSLDQNAMGIPVQQTTFANGKLHLDIPAAQGSQYDGTLNSGGDEIAGTFAIRSLPFPLLLKRVDKIEMLNRTSRTQDPKPPYPYAAENVGYENKGIHLAGTLTLPRGQGPFPAAVMITGSGAQDRDETILGHKSFWVIADYLTRRGIAILRVDDRGVGKSTGNSSQATFDDMAGDVLAGADYLAARKEIDSKHIGVIGHSEGASVGTLAATRSSRIAFVVMLAGMGVSGEQVLSLQGESALREIGATEETIALDRKLQNMVADALRSESDPKAAVAKMSGEWQRMKTNLSESQRKVVQAPSFSEPAMNQKFTLAASPEMRSIILWNPGEILRQLQVPILALNGSRDIQVSAKQNLPAITAFLAEAASTDFAVVELPGLNHLFQECHKCTVAEYGDLDQTFSPIALATMGDWLLRHTRPEE